MLTGIIRDDVQVRAMFHCVEVGAIDADLRKTVGFCEETPKPSETDVDAVWQAEHDAEEDGEQG